MFRSLYAKLMVLFLAALLVAMGALSGLLAERIRADKIEARLSELTIQARDVAFLAARLYTVDSLTVQRYLLWKAEEIMLEFDANIVLIDRFNNLIPIGDDRFEVLSDVTQEDLLPLLNRVIAGEEVGERTIQSDTGNPVFTVGVPFLQDGAVLGGVFIHTSEQSVQASYRGILVEVLRALAIALVIGAALVLAACRYITRPMRAMALAAERFARGDFGQRVRVETRDEVGRLAEAFNGMAVDLGRLEQTRRDFVANVSHELRSPLTSIQGFITGLMDGTVPPEDRQRCLGIVLDETRRLSKLITALLDLSQIQNGQTPLACAHFDVNEMIRRVALRQEAFLTQRDLAVDFDLLGESLMVRADADRIEQVLVNLVDNAAKYACRGVALSTRRERGKVVVSVADDGPGIAPEDLPYVFDRFYMADKARTAGQGTGLGLSIAKGILEQHGQTIAAFSKPGQGTRFEFTLEGAY